ncbi:hypothetical protein RN001_013830 [Aquatica leii]|uniref:Uncharacterized protein n=1 Tax=Aquatica leii TaxID=1421715 RepID=A0AAN7SNW1_9COLE|nr:hypothetical protein RN001_013830 [Aquatica leii]
MEQKFMLECIELIKANKPSLWYFKKMMFIHYQEAPLTSQSTMSSQNKNEVEVENAKRSNVSQLISLACKRLQQPYTEYHKIATTSTTKHANMKPLQQLFAKKSNNNILFESQMSTLNKNSVQINAASFYPTHSSTPFRAPSMSTVCRFQKKQLKP